MLFIEKYDPGKTLEEQVEFPLSITGSSIFLNIQSGKYVLQNDNSIFNLSSKCAKYATSVVMDGYVSDEEFLSTFHHENTNMGTVKVTIFKLNMALAILTKSDEKLIKRRKGANISRNAHSYASYDPGFYFGSLAKHRKNRDYINNGFVLNDLTGCLTLPDGTAIEDLIPAEFQLVSILHGLRAGGTISLAEIQNKLSDYDTFSNGKNTLQSNIATARQKIGKGYFPNSNTSNSFGIYRLVNPYKPTS